MGASPSGWLRTAKAVRHNGNGRYTGGGRHYGAVRHKRGGRHHGSAHSP